MNVYLVAYDISSDKRRQRVYDTLHAYGVRVQYSVWWCTLTRRAAYELRVALYEMIHKKEDHIIVIDLGPCEGRVRSAISQLGKHVPAPEIRHAYIF